MTIAFFLGLHHNGFRLADPHNDYSIYCVWTWKFHHIFVRRKFLRMPNPLHTVFTDQPKYLLFSMRLPVIRNRIPQEIWHPLRQFLRQPL